jgi:hypothetical protein
MGGVDTHPDLPVVEPGWLPPGAWRWIAAAVPVGAVIGLAAAAIVGVGPVDPDQGAARAAPTLATQPPIGTTTRAAPAPHPTFPVVIVVPGPAAPKGHDEPDTTPRTPAPSPTPGPAPSSGPPDRGADGDGPGVDPGPSGPSCPPTGPSAGPQHGDGSGAASDSPGTPAPVGLRAPGLELDVRPDLAGVVADPCGAGAP